MTEFFDELRCEDCEYNQFSKHPDGKIKPITRVCNGCGNDLIKDREETIKIAKAQIDFILEKEK